MKITFLGGADEVGASCTLIEIAGKHILVDAGIRPSPKARWGLAGDALPDLSQIDAQGSLDAILVTHAHTDHTGALELVTSRFPGVPAYATPLTIALVRVLHQDARRIMQTRLDEEGELPLFDDVAVQGLMAAFTPVPFHTRVPLGEGVAVTFFPAGHIAGAAMLGLESDEGRVLLTGDLSISPQRTVDGARPPAFHPDLVVLESTYGGRLHANRAVQERKLVETVAQVIGEGGKVLIPAFALGRAQEVLLILGEFQRRGELPAVPMWADGMVRAICQAYSSFPEVLPLALQEREAQFFGGLIRPVESQAQRQALVWEAAPAMIVASSGMLAGGPSVEYARALAGSPQHAILLTGYQDEESPGRHLQRLAERGHGALRLGKSRVDVQCHLGTYALSAHADEGELISLIETLDPHHILLVHGDDTARASLEGALSARGRIVHLPRAGQSLEFHFDLRRPLRAKTAKAPAPLDLATLWQEINAQAGGLYSLEDLALAWWGEATADRLAALNAALASDDLYFQANSLRPGVYRARTAAQVELIKRRRQQMAALPELAGRWLVLRQPGGGIHAALCTAVARDHFFVQAGDAPQQIAFPEDLLGILGESPPAEADLQAYRPQPAAPVVMEPNQAIAYARQRFPPEARLRKVGYRLAEQSLVLNFDFPDAARQQFAELIDDIRKATGWQVELDPEANQAALNALVRELLPEDWHISGSPAIYREKKRVEAVVSAPPAVDEAGFARASQAAARFQEISGYELALSRAVTSPAPARLAASTTPTTSVASTNAGGRMEINAAYALLKSALAGSSLYRTSLKGDEIVLSFISPQVGERYRAEIEMLARQTGWPLSISPQANQGAILEVARALLVQAGWHVVKGPGIYPERDEVSVTVDAEPQAEELAELQEDFAQKTGFRLVLNTRQAPTVPQKPDYQYVVEIPLERVRLRPYQQSIALDPDKLHKAVERARRMGISPPIQVRRLADGYLLLDGLYRLRAAQAVGLALIPAIVE